MKNEDLINQLKEYNPNAEVTTPYSEDIVLAYIDCDGQCDKSNTPLIFIEWADSCPTCVHEYMHEEEGVRWCSFYDKACKDVEECYQFEEFDER